MQTHLTITTPKLPTDVGVVMGTTNTPGLLEIARAVEAAHAKQKAESEHSKTFQSKAGRRPVSSHSHSWRRGGINE